MKSHKQEIKDLGKPMSYWAGLVEIPPDPFRTYLAGQADTKKFESKYKKQLNKLRSLLKKAIARKKEEDAKQAENFSNDGCSRSSFLDKLKPGTAAQPPMAQPPVATPTGLQRPVAHPLSELESDEESPWPTKPTVPKDFWGESTGLAWVGDPDGKSFDELPYRWIPRSHEVLNGREARMNAMHKSGSKVFASAIENYGAETYLVHLVDGTKALFHTDPELGLRFENEERMSDFAQLYDREKCTVGKTPFDYYLAPLEPKGERIGRLFVQLTSELWLPKHQHVEILFVLNGQRVSCLQKVFYRGQPVGFYSLPKWPFREVVNSFEPDIGSTEAFATNFSGISMTVSLLDPVRRAVWQDSEPDNQQPFIQLDEGVLDLSGGLAGPKFLPYDPEWYEWVKDPKKDNADETEEVHDDDAW